MESVLRLSVMTYYKRTYSNGEEQLMCGYCLIFAMNPCLEKVDSFSLSSVLVWVECFLLMHDRALTGPHIQKPNQ